MNLLQIRTQFVQMSGRYDLVTDPTTYADNGADTFINAGIHLLGRLANVPESNARLFYALSAGEYSITFQHKCKVIHEVWINDSEQRYQAEKISLNKMKTNFADPVGDITSNYPYYFAIANLRALETTAEGSLATFIDKVWDESDTNYDYRGILLAPPADKTYTVEINGVFKQANLSADADENFWTIEEPTLVTRAALYQLESMTRGSTNIRQWLDSIKVDVTEIDKDVVDEQIFDVDQMEG